jgi:hypothetical protein
MGGGSAVRRATIASSSRESASSPASPAGLSSAATSPRKREQRFPARRWSSRPLLVSAKTVARRSSGLGERSSRPRLSRRSSSWVMPAGLTAKSRPSPVGLVTPSLIHVRAQKSVTANWSSSSCSATSRRSTRRLTARLSKGVPDAGWWRRAERTDPRSTRAAWDTVLTSFGAIHYSTVVIDATNRWSNRSASKKKEEEGVGEARRTSGEIYSGRAMPRFLRSRRWSAGGTHSTSR